MDTKTNTPTCMCGHYDRNHKDTDVFSGWGEGECTLCDCKKFVCKCEYGEGMDTKTNLKDELEKEVFSNPYWNTAWEDEDRAECESLVALFLEKTLETEKTKWKREMIEWIEKEKDSRDDPGELGGGIQSGLDIVIEQLNKLNTL